MDRKTRFAILVSGRGSNMVQLIRSAQENLRDSAEIVCVLSDQEHAPALERATQLGVAAHFLSPGEKYKTRMTDEAEQAWVEFLQEQEIDYILLAGFMRMLKHTIIEAFPNRIINIHPSLLPKYPGLDTHARVLEEGEHESGCTIHFVDQGMDTGKIIAQAVVPVHDDDTAESLAARVLEQEHRLYPMVLGLLSRREIDSRSWQALIVRSGDA